jgi:hypothetical protein
VQIARVASPLAIGIRIKERRIQLKSEPIDPLTAGIHSLTRKYVDHLRKILAEMDR